MITRNYKLAANFITVELTIDHDDLMTVLDWETEVMYDQDDIPAWDVTDEELITRVLQREYDILAGIKGVNGAPPAQGTKTPNKEVEEPASEKQIKWAKNLGMKNHEKASKKEVWKFIQEHKDDEK